MPPVDEAIPSGLARDDNVQWTYDLIRRRCAGDVALDLASLPSDGVLDGITGDDRGACGTQTWED